MGTTPIYGFPFPDLDDAPNVPADVQALAGAVDTTVDSIDDRLDLVEPLKDPPACRVTRSTTQSCADAVFTTISWNSERFDTNTMHDLATNTSRITFTTAGLYEVGFAGALAAGNDYIRAFAQLVKNGATTIVRGSQVATTTTVQPQISVSTVYKFLAADYVEVQVFQDNTANASRTLDKTDEWTPEFWAVRLGSGV